MKEIKALIRPDRFDVVLGALHKHPELPGVTLSEVSGFGRTVGRADENEDVSVGYGTAKMFKLECVVNDEDVDAVIALVQQAAQTGNVGDGKIFVYDVERSVKIRTGEWLSRFE